MALGVLLAAVWLSILFGRVRAQFVFWFWLVLWGRWQIWRRIYSSLVLRASRFCAPEGSSWPWASCLPLSRYLPTSAECAQDKLGKFSDRKRHWLRSAQSFVKGFWSERLDAAEPRTARIMSMGARNVAGTCR